MHVCADEKSCNAVDKVLADLQRYTANEYSSCIDCALYLINRGSGSSEQKAKLLNEACLSGNFNAVKELVEIHNVDPNGEFEASFCDRQWL